MNFLQHCRSRWQHQETEVRRKAVEHLKDPAQLRTIAMRDPDESVRRAAFDRIVDGETLVEIARRGGEFSAIAVERLTETSQLVHLVGHASSSEVRAAAVARINDPEVLRQIADVDPDPLVRRNARRKRAVPDCLREQLRDHLTKLEIAERVAHQVAEFCESLDEVCGDIISDGRFEIHGLVTDSHPGEEFDQFPQAAETVAPFGHQNHRRPRQFVELLAGQLPDERTKSGPAESAFFRIKVWRIEADSYTWAVEQRRVSMKKDLVAWSRSSGDATGSAPAVGESASPLAH